MSLAQLAKTKMHREKPMNSLRLFTIVLISCSLQGCSATSVYDVAKPTDITLSQAMADIGRGLGSFKNELKNQGIKTGLIVDEATVTFNVAASANNTNKLVLDASTPILVGSGPGSLKLNTENTLVTSASRGNQIVIKLKSIYTTPLNELGKKQEVPKLGPDCDPTTQICMFSKKPRLPTQ
jgi:hypothetical protein